ncbi:hypothetical protein GCM10011405_31740 [Rufibacter glacialis]|nr:hypothetical protein GCM10011405_31740 [Rufibacter glacialis]
MARLMIDIHLAEAVIGRTIPNYDTSRVAYKQAHSLLLKRHAVSDSAFKHSYDYYLAHPEQFDKIYEVVLDSLSAREAKLTAQQAAPTVDSTTTVSDTSNVAKDTTKAVLTKFKRVSGPDSL